MTLDDLREDSQAVRKFIMDEFNMRKAMAQSSLNKAELWQEKAAEADKVLAAHRRCMNYIATTNPASRLESRPQQAEIFGDGGEA